MNLMLDRRGLIGGGFAAAAGLANSTSSKAQDWPSKPIKIICGYPPGGSVDAFARAYGEHLASRLQQPAIVENKSGAGSIIACETVARARPDGYTLLFTDATALFQNRALYKSLPYDPDKDFTKIAMMPAGHLPLYTHKSVAAKNLAEFVAYARTNKVNFGTYSAGSLAHVVCAKLNETYGLKMEAIHYRGQGPMWADMNAGSIQAAVGAYQAALPVVQAGNANAIAVPTRKRMLRKMPDVATFFEQGATHPYFLLEGITAVLAPAGVPQPIVERVSALMTEGGSTLAIQRILDQFGIEEAAKDYREFDRFFREDGPQLIAAVKELGLEPI